MRIPLLTSLALSCLVAACSDQTTVAPSPPEATPHAPVATRIVNVADVDGHTPPWGVTCRSPAGAPIGRAYISEIRFVSGELMLRGDSTFQWTYAVDRTQRTVGEPVLSSHGTLAYRQQGFFRVRSDTLVLTYVYDGPITRPDDEWTLSYGRVADRGFELTYLMFSCLHPTEASFRTLTLRLRG
jgi:hypothetical protein